MRLATVLLAYNEAAQIEAAIRNIIAQREGPDEIVVVDDGSADATAEIVTRLAATESRLRLGRHPHNRGIVAALNTGLAETKGDLVHFAAADDRLLPGFYRAVRAVFARHPSAGLVSGRSRHAAPNGADLGIFPTPRVLPRAGFLPSETAVATMYRRDNWFMGNAAVFRTEPLRALGGFDPVLGGFADAWCCMALAARHGAGFFPEALAVKRDILSGTGSSLFGDPQRSHEVLAQVLARMERHGFDARFRGRFRRRWAFKVAGLALARNGSSAPRRAWAILTLAPFDAIEILRRKRERQADAAMNQSQSPV